MSRPKTDWPGRVSAPRTVIVLSSPYRSWCRDGPTANASGRCLFQTRNTDTTRSQSLFVYPSFDDRLTSVEMTHNIEIGSLNDEAHWSEIMLGWFDPDDLV